MPELAERGRLLSVRLGKTGPWVRIPASPKIPVDKKIKLLKRYFEKEETVTLAFLFGSQTKGIKREISDWDIGVYFEPKEYLELESEHIFSNEDKIWSELIEILQTDNIDLLVLNRVRPDLVYSVLNSGIPLVIKSHRLYLDLLCKTNYEAIDWWDFVYDFWKISQKAHSFLPEEKVRILRYLKFLEDEFSQIREIKKIDWLNYQEDAFKRKIIERWVENLVVVSLDIAKIVLASKKRNIPSTYKETLKIFSSLELKLPLKEAKEFSDFTKLRNIIVHEYLDIKWKKIKDFLSKAERLYPKFIGKIKKN